MTYNLIKNVKTHRWIIVATIFVAIVCNYLDRQLLSILKPEILAHYDITNLEYAWIVNIFLICYAVMYPMAGMLVDRFGPKRVSEAALRPTPWCLPSVVAFWDRPSPLSLRAS